MIYKIIDLHNYLLMTLHGKIIRGLFKHERLKQAMLRTSEGNVSNLSIHAGFPFCWNNCSKLIFSGTEL